MRRRLPAAIDELDLAVIPNLRERYPDVVVGLSDHQDGIAMSLVAYMLGARVIEKHFTLSHAAEGDRPRVLARAGGDAEARPRPTPGADRRSATASSGRCRRS